MPIKVSIVEDDAKLRASLAVLLEGSAGFACVGAHPTAAAALKHIPREHPDVVLMDLYLPDRLGTECVRALKARLPHLPILMLTIAEEEDQVFAALEAGASGYLVKGDQMAKTLEAIAEVHRGGAPMSSQVARQVIRFFNQRGRVAQDMANLTPREQEVLALLSQGYSDKEIAEKLRIGERGVGSHCRSIYEKLHVHSRTAAAVKYLKQQ